MTQPVDDRQFFPRDDSPQEPESVWDVIGRNLAAARITLEEAGKNISDAFAPLASFHRQYSSVDADREVVARFFGTARSGVHSNHIHVDWRHPESKPIDDLANALKKYNPGGVIPLPAPPEPIFKAGDVVKINGKDFQIMSVRGRPGSFTLTPRDGREVATPLVDGSSGILQRDRDTGRLRLAGNFLSGQTQE